MLGKWILPRITVTVLFRILIAVWILKAFEIKKPGGVAISLKFKASLRLLVRFSAQYLQVGEANNG